MLPVFKQPANNETMIMVLVLFFLISYLVIIARLQLDKKRVFYPRVLGALFLTGVIIASILMLVVVVFLFYLHSDVVIINDELLLPYWLLIVFSAIMSGVSYYNLGRHALCRRPGSEYISVVITQTGFVLAKQSLRQYFFRLRKWLLLFLIAGAPLVAAWLFPPHIMISVFIDNSLSMKKEFDEAQAAMISFSEQVPENTTFLLSMFEKTLEINELKSSTKEVYSSRHSSRLKAASLSSFGSPKEFKQFLRQDQPFSKIPSPITEAIWALYMKSIEEDQGNNFTRKYLIILTDGIGYLSEQKGGNYDIVHQVSQNNQKRIIDYFSEIKVVNMTDRGSNPFFNSIPGAYIVEGEAHEPFGSVLKDTLADLYKGHFNLVLWFCIPILFLLLFCLLCPIFTKLKAARYEQA